MSIELQNGSAPPVNGSSAVAEMPPEAIAQGAAESPSVESSGTPAEPVSEGAGEGAAQSQATRNLVEAFAARGYEFDDEYDDDQLLSDFEELQSELDAIPDKERLARLAELEKYEADLPEFLKWKHNQASGESSETQSAAEPPEKAKASTDQVRSTDTNDMPLHPDVEALLTHKAPDKFAFQMLQQGEIVADQEKGAYVASRPGLEQYAQQLNEYAVSKSKFRQAWEEDPVGLAWKMIAPRFEQKLKELEDTIKPKVDTIDSLNKKSQEESSLDQINQYLTANQDRFINDDGSLSDQGHAYNEFFQDYLDDGVQDRLEAHQKALAKIDRKFGGKSEGQGSTAASSVTNGANGKGRRRLGMLKKRREEGTNKVAAQQSSTDRTVDRGVPDSQNVPQQRGRQSLFLDMVKEEMARQS